MGDTKLHMMLKIDLVLTINRSSLERTIDLLRQQIILIIKATTLAFIATNYGPKAIDVKSSMKQRNVHTMVSTNKFFISRQSHKMMMLK
jgi:hypothetical protein